MESTSTAGPLTFAAYLAKFYVARRGFVPGTIPDAHALAAACDQVLTYSDGVTVRIMCLVDCDADPARQFGMSPEALRRVAEQCAQHAGRVQWPRIPITIDIFEIGMDALTADRQARLKQLSEASTRKVSISVWIADTMSRSTWTNAALGGVFRDRRLIQRLLNAPPLPDSALQPITVLTQPLAVPYATYALLAVLAAIFVVECMAGLDPSKFFTPSIGTLFAMGGLNWKLVVEQGEWYRLLSATFLHANVMHLVMNGIGLYLAAVPLERLLHRAWFAAVYAVSAVGGSFMSLAFNTPNTVGVGASGAIMGLFAAGLVVSYRFPPGQLRSLLQANAVPVLVLSVLPVTSTAGAVDLAAHVGGALSGAGMGVVLLAIWPRNIARPGFQAAAMAIAGMALLATAATFVPIVQGYGNAMQARTLSAELIPAAQYPKSFDEGKRQSVTLVADYPRDPRAHFYRAAALIEAKDLDGAIRELRLALAEREILNNVLPSFQGALQFTLAGALADRAYAYRQKGEFDRALTDYNEIIALNIYDPKLDLKMRQSAAKIRPHFHRGIVYTQKQNYAAAIADFNEAIRLDPADTAAYSARGRTLFLQGDFATAVPDLRRFATGANDNEPYNFGMIWLYLAQARSNVDGTAELAERAAKLKTKKWPYPVIELYLGRQSADATLSAAAGSDEYCEAQYYVGVWRLLRGQRDAAISLLRPAADTCPKNFIEYEGALAELKRLGQR